MFENNLYGRIDRINRAVEYIEEHLDKQMNFGVPANIMLVSIYEFRRIFSYIAGIPVSDYIRNRKLSLAALELQSKKCSVTEVAAKYGYDSSSSFARAFKELHGVSPSEAEKPGVTLKMIPKLQFKIYADTNDTFSFRIESKDSFSIIGYKGKSPVTDTNCCESVWKKYERTTEEKLKKARLFEENAGQFACYYNDDESLSVECTVGAYCSSGCVDAEGFDITPIPSSRWAVFDVTESKCTDINMVYDFILFQWLPSSCFVKDNSICNLEYFPPQTDNEDYSYQICFPIKEKDDNR